MRLGRGLLAARGLGSGRRCANSRQSLSVSADAPKPSRVTTCATHGLGYDLAQHSGCIRCRQLEVALSTEASGSGSTQDSLKLLLGLLLTCAVDLRSTAFAIERRGDSLHLTGRGFGHGVGMCVIGAGRRSMRGESARTILDQYYPGLEVTPL